MQRGLFVMRPADRSGLARRPDDDQTQTNQYGNAAYPLWNRARLLDAGGKWAEFDHFFLALEIEVAGERGNAYGSQDDAGNDQTHAHDASPWIVDVRGEYAGLNVNKDLHGRSRM